MKTFLLMMTCLAFAIGFMVSAGPVTALATSAPHFPQTLPYYYLSNPTMMTTDGERFFVVDDGELLVFTDVNDFISHSIDVSNALFIKWANNHLHVFRTDNVRRYNSILNHANTVPFGANFSYFDVDIHGNIFRSNQRIVADNLGGYFTIVEEPFFGFQNIYRPNGTRVNDVPFVNITSIAYMGGSFAIISNNANNASAITFFNQTTRSQVPITTETFYLVTDSVSPYFVTHHAGNIFVIDQTKKSIDKYQITPAGFVFEDIVMASSGMDNGDFTGFFILPQAMTVLTHGEYIVADRAGQIRRIDIDGRAENFGNLANLDIRTMAFDYHSFVYMFDFNTQRIMQFNLNGTLRQTFTQAFTNVVQLVTDFDQNLYVITTTRVYILNGTTFVPYLTRNTTTSTRAIYINGAGLQFSPNLYIADAKNQAVRINNLPNGLFNPSVHYCRMTDTLFYIDTLRHVVNSMTLGRQVFDDSDHAVIDDTALLYTDDKFLSVNNVVLFQFPNGINSRGAVSGVVKILEQNTGFNFTYVLYENPLSGAHIKGYIHDPKTTPNLQNNTNFSLFGFEVARRPTVSQHYSARVILPNTPIFKFPSTELGIVLGHLPVNFNNPTSGFVGLKLHYVLTVRDSNNTIFFQIPISHNGTTYVPDPNGLSVGFIEANSVVDFYRPESTPRFAPNATVNFAVTLNPNGLPTFSAPNLDARINYVYIPNNQPIYIIGRFDENAPFTFVRFFDAQLNDFRDVWVQTQYVVPNGISVWQIIALVTLGLIIVGTTVIIIGKRKRTL